MGLDNNVINLWWHYEEIAMHFNNLLIQYRLQLMGGAGAVGAIASYFVASHVDNPERRHTIRVYITTGLLILISAAVMLDLCYYNELLIGAVEALLKIEREHPEIYMSTLIAKRFEGEGLSTIYVVYILILVPLFILTVWSWIVFVRERLAGKAQ